MAHVVAAARLGRQFHVTGNLSPFAFGADSFVSVFPAVASVVDVTAPQEGVVFTVGGDDDVFGRRRAHRFQHHLPALDTASVIGEGDAPALEGMEIDQFLSKPSDGDGPVGEYPDQGVPVDGILLHGQMFGGVRHRIEIGHRAHERISAARRGLTAGADGFFPGLSRFTEMYVKVGECG